MKPITFSVLLIVFSFSQASSQEFTVYPNGLIYSENAVGKLKHIVDSLNLKFKVCDVNKTYKSVSQAKANYILLERKKVSQAKKDMDNNMPFQQFAEKYPAAFQENNLIVTKGEYFDEYDNQTHYYISDAGLGKDSGNYIYFDAKENQSITKTAGGKWVYSYSKKTPYSDERIEAFYVTEDFKSKALPKKYARLIEYSDCLIDTTAQVFRKDAKESRFVYYNDSIPNKARDFNEYVENKLNRPEFPRENYRVLFDYDSISIENPDKEIKLNKTEQVKREQRRQKQVEAEYKQFHLDMAKWESLRLARLDSLRTNDPNFMPMLTEAYDQTKLTGFANPEFEEYVALFISKDSALEMKRNRRVVGGCSMDSSPRIHAMQIAMLSAETTKWEIFLRSHLDIMNDRFDRVSDGSYAQAGRQTYIRELEVLDINTIDLILGISLRFENAAPNHYFASIGRTGRAMAESNSKKELEAQMLGMISDNELDDFNRILMYYLFENYNYHLADKNLQDENIERLKMAVSTMPDYISSKIKFQKT